MTAINTWDELFLPWTESANDRRFKEILRNTLIAFTIIALLLTFLPKPIPPTTIKNLSEVSPRLAKLIIEKKKEPPPPPVPVVENKPVEKVEPEQKPEPKPEPEVKPKDDPKPIPQKNPEQARAKASRSGLLALSNKLTTLQDSFDVKDFSDTPLKKQTSASTKSGKDDIFKTDIITSGVAETSKGIGSKAIATSSSGTRLAERSTSNVKSDLIDATAASEKRGGGGGGSGSTRSEAEIARIFEENKSAIYSMYNRALRGDPSLQGKVVLELTIEADGSVSACRVISSELNNAEFEKKLMARVKLFRFKPGNIKPAVIKYPIDFVPS